MDFEYRKVTGICGTNYAKKIQCNSYHVGITGHIFMELFLIWK